MAGHQSTWGAASRCQKGRAPTPRLHRLHQDWPHLHQDSQVIRLGRAAPARPRRRRYTPARAGCERVAGRALLSRISRVAPACTVSSASGTCAGTRLRRDSPHICAAIRPTSAPRLAPHLHRDSPTSAPRLARVCAWKARRGLPRVLIGPRVKPLVAVCVGDVHRNARARHCACNSRTSPTVPTVPAVPRTRGTTHPEYFARQYQQPRRVARHFGAVPAMP